MKDKNMKLRKFLLSIGISANIQGYFYILDAIKFLNKQKIHTNMVTLYEILGKKYNKTSSQIERAIRYSITQSYKSNEKLKEIYNKIPENSAFFYDLVFNFDLLENYTKGGK